MEKSFWAWRRRTNRALLLALILSAQLLAGKHDMKAKDCIIIFFGAILLTAVVTLNSMLGWARVQTETSLAQVDELLAAGKNQKALSVLQELPDSLWGKDEKLWRMARLYYEMGRRQDEDVKAGDLYREAESFARQAISVAPENDEGYKWLAIILGALTKEADTRTQVRLSKEVKRNIEKAIVLDPQDDISYLVLSRWHYKVSGLGFFAQTFAKLVYGGLPEASLDKAESLLWHAINIQDRIAHRYNLAKVYKRMGRRKDAMAQLRLALLLPVTFPEENEELDKARKKLKKWQ
jgi:tetratricopeptide (TPR) repeat protein